MSRLPRVGQPAPVLLPEPGVTCRTDPRIAELRAQLLAVDAAVLGLRRQVPDCLDGLEDLVCLARAERDVGLEVRHRTPPGVLEAADLLRVKNEPSANFQSGLGARNRLRCWQPAGS